MQQMCWDGIIGIFLLICSWQDMRKKQISERLLICFGIVGILYVMMHKGNLFGVLIGIIPGCMLLVFGWLTKQAIGYGDGLLLLILGLFLSIGKVVALLGISLCLASFFVVFLFFINRLRRRMTLPFVPFLGIGWMMVVLCEKGGTFGG